MNGEQKGGVKNHFQTLFRILKKLFKKRQIKEAEEEVKQNQKLVKHQEREQIVSYNVYQKNAIKKLPKEGKARSILVRKSIGKQVGSKPLINQASISLKNDSNNVKNLKINNDAKINGIVHKNSRKGEKFEQNKQIVKKTNKGKKRNPQKFVLQKVDTRKKDSREITIIERVNKIITDDKYDLGKLQIELYKIDRMVYSVEDKDKMKKLQEQFIQIMSKIEKIKRDFKIIKESGYLENYKELNDYFLLEEIDNFKFSNDLETIELLSLQCKQQIVILNDISEIYDKAISTSKKIEKQNDKIDYIYDNSQEFMDQTDNLNIISRKIDDNLALQNKFIIEMNNKIGSAHKDVKFYYKQRGLNDLLNNTLSMGLGMYSFSSMRKKPHFKGLKFLVGSFLMYNSIRGMLKFLSPERKKITYIYYDDYAKELDRESYRLSFTNSLLNHSLRDVSLLKEDFKSKFMVYQYQIPEYDAMLEKIEKIEKQLKLQKLEVEEINKNLTNQKQKNKEYVKKIEKYED